MFVGKLHHLICLCLGHFLRVDPTLANSCMVNVKHEMRCGFTIHIENLLDHVHDKFHRRDVIVQEQHTPLCVFSGIIHTAHPFAYGTKVSAEI